jgi:hypothetical protein
MDFGISKNYFYFYFYFCRFSKIENLSQNLSQNLSKNDEDLFAMAMI